MIAAGPRSSNPTSSQGLAVVFAILLAISVASCSDAQPSGAPVSDDPTGSTASTTAEGDASPMMSIPFCPAEGDHSNDFGDADMDAALAEGQVRLEAIERVRGEYGHNSSWSDVAFDWATEEIVFQFLDSNLDRETAIQTLVGPDHMVRFEVVRSTGAELKAATSALTEILNQQPGQTPVSSAGPSFWLNRVGIFIVDLTKADHLAEMIGLPPPYDIYCLHREERPYDENA